MLSCLWVINPDVYEIRHGVTLNDLECVILLGVSRTLVILANDTSGDCHVFLRAFERDAYSITCISRFNVTVNRNTYKCTLWE